MAWEIGYVIDGEWKFKGDYQDARQAVCMVAFETGVACISNLHENGTWEVKACLDGRQVACVRERIEDLANKPGAVPEGRLGPLKRYRGLTWVGWLNSLVLRFFLFRLWYTVEKDNTISRYWVKFEPTWRW